MVSRISRKERERETSASQWTLQRTIYQTGSWLLKDRQTYRPDVQERTQACFIQPGERSIRRTDVSVPGTWHNKVDGLVGKQQCRWMSDASALFLVARNAEVLLNRIQDTLPKLANLKTWNKQALGLCVLSGYCNCTMIHIFNYCQYSFRSGR